MRRTCLTDLFRADFEVNLMQQHSEQDIPRTEEIEDTQSVCYATDML